MYRLFVLRNDKSGCFGGHALISLWALLLCSGIRRIGPEHCSRIEGEPTIQHSALLISWVCRTQRAIAREHCLLKTMCCDFSKAASPSHR